MSSSSRPAGLGTWWRAREAAGVGWRLFLAENPPRVLFWATGLRGVMQAVFFILLGRALVGGFDRADAFLGAMAIVIAGPNVVGVANVPLADKEFGTFWRVRTAALSPAACLAARAAAYPATAIVILLVQAGCTALLLGQVGHWLLVVRFLPLFALMGLSAAVLGLAAATLSIGKRADVLAPNLVSYLILLGSGAFLPPGRVPWLDTIGAVVPARHALQAVRLASSGKPWVAEAALEVAVIALWSAAGLIAVRVQTARARRLGHDDFE